MLNSGGTLHLFTSGTSPVGQVVAVVRVCLQNSLPYLIFNYLCGEDIAARKRDLYELSKRISKRTFITNLS